MSHAEIEIRVLVENDAEQLLILRRLGLKEEPAAFTSTYEDSLSLTVSDIAGNLAANNNSFVYGAFDNSNLVGMTGFHRYKEGAKTAHKGLIWGVYLKPEYRSKGIAKKLLQAVLSRARNLDGIELVHLGVNAANLPVVKLYESVGFTKWGSDPKALKVDGQYIDEDRMVLFFT
jgi:RimJ/RimL family protein N-acetyltransferase